MNEPDPKKELHREAMKTVRFFLFCATVVCVVLVLAGTARADTSDMAAFWDEQCARILDAERCSRTQLALAKLHPDAQTETYLMKDGTYGYRVLIDSDLYHAPKYQRAFGMYEWQVAIIHELCHIRVGHDKKHRRKWQQCAKRFDIELDAKYYGSNK